jgi:hypothetical protein
LLTAINASVLHAMRLRPSARSAVPVALKREHVDCSFRQRIPGLATALSAIFMNTSGDRTIVTYCDQRIATTTPTDADAAVAVADVLLADNCFPDFVLPICVAARRRRLPVVVPRILCAGVIVLDEVVSCRGISATGRQGAGEWLFRRHWRLRGECCGGDRAARRARAPRRSDGRSERQRH